MREGEKGRKLGVRVGGMVGVVVMWVVLMGLMVLKWGKGREDEGLWGVGLKMAGEGLLGKVSLVGV